MAHKVDRELAALMHLFVPHERLVADGPSMHLADYSDRLHESRKSIAAAIRAEEREKVARLVEAVEHWQHADRDYVERGADLPSSHTLSRAEAEMIAALAALKAEEGGNDAR